MALHNCIAAVFFMIVNASQLFIKSVTTVWLIPLLSFISITMIFLLVYIDESQITINLGQKKLLHTLFFPVFFLDKNKKIIYANQLGKKICPNILENRKIIGYKQDIFDHFIPYDSNLQVASDYEDGAILLQSVADGTIYYLIEQSLSQKTKERDYENGEMLMLVSVSFMQKFITHLEDKAFKDSLCGCYSIRRRIFCHPYIRAFCIEWRTLQRHFAHRHFPAVLLLFGPGHGKYLGYPAV